jgi:hypothetical protein
MRTLSRIAPSSALLIALAFSRSAEADPMRLQVDWGKTLLLGQEWLITGARAEKASAEPGASAPGGTEGALEDTTPWVGVAPHLSVLGRDWNESFVFTGRLTTTDVLRLTQSNRMLLTRVRFGDGVIVPFAQLGFGQWRVDTNMLPGWACDTEVAAEVGAGFELRVRKAYSFAIESDYTVLYRDQPEPTNIPYARIWFWGATAATRIRF